MHKTIIDENTSQKSEFIKPSVVEKFKKFQKKLNTISSNIKSLEKELQSYDLVFEASFVIKSGFEHLAGDRILMKFEDPYINKELPEGSYVGNNVTKNNIRELLRWKKDDSSKKFRIFYTQESYSLQWLHRESHSEQDSKSYFDYSSYDSEIVFEKPLIECSQEIRLLASVYLIDFVDVISNECDKFNF